MQKERQDIRFLRLFLIFFKIGLVTFGGGYAMLSIVEREIVDSNKYLDRDTYYDFVSIAQGFPGPIAVNISLLVGNRLGGFLGSVVAMMGVVLPSFLVILVIAIFYGFFRNSRIVVGFFNGVAGVVPTLLLVSFLSMANSIKKKPVTGILFVVTTVAVAYFNINPIYLILLGGGVGLCIYYFRPS